MGLSCTVMSKEVLVVELFTPAILATLSMEMISGSVCPSLRRFQVGVGQIQCVKVSLTFGLYSVLLVNTMCS